eukprot:CAMPEP_0173392928 /NCGR_PEP_ID=MMETSP1356-20130122/21815_1 /TAXON_ID=77927 ORGANISM="Hemiselmis virescens, Strain PCC157" /NCGR_SAMPLE_ID=MMETSP1356 /ASSEMBLY_ACC=CAM_ASM_000847 /LENGTH=204 /DNA_ID=CAMNT_0014350867 /DNA_START=407 /DNA_END=1021 /DNA_ORIENTATION=+
MHLLLVSDALRLLLAPLSRKESLEQKPGHSDPQETLNNGPQTPLLEGPVGNVCIEARDVGADRLEGPLARLLVVLGEILNAAVRCDVGVQVVKRNVHDQARDSHLHKVWDRTPDVSHNLEVHRRLAVAEVREGVLALEEVHGAHGRGVAECDLVLHSGAPKELKIEGQPKHPGRVQNVLEALTLLLDDALLDAVARPVAVLVVV